MPRIVVRPLLATLVLHSLVLALMTVNWSTPERKVVKVKPTPVAINATLVDASDLRPKPKPKPQPKPQPKPRAQPKPKPVEKPAPKPVVKPKAEPRPQKTEPKPVEKPVEKTAPKLTPAQLAALAQAELADAVATEDAQATATAAELSASYAALIQQTVINYWSRPPSARNGMEALLQIQLIPTGEVQSVSLLKSSGNTAFDRSAINAVEKAGSFPELQKLPSAEFEKNFRRFRLLFRPEDLRY
jgi:TonB family protein